MPMKLAFAFLMLFATVSFAASPAAAFDWMVTNVTEYRMALAAAAPGDKILLAPGTYMAAAGRKGLQDVTITSQDPNNPAILDGSVGTGNRVLQLSSASNVIIPGVCQTSCPLISCGVSNF
jgi:hypothetical protein